MSEQDAGLEVRYEVRLTDAEKTALRQPLVMGAVAKFVDATRADERNRLSYRPYASDATLVAVHADEWADAQEAMSKVPTIEDHLAGAIAREKLADALVATLEGLIAANKYRALAAITVDYIEHALNEFDGGNR